MTPTETGLLLYHSRFFESRLQAGDPLEPPLVILSLTTAETHQSLVLAPEEVTELLLAAAATLTALADQPGDSPVLAALHLLLADELAAAGATAAIGFRPRPKSIGAV